MAYAMLSACGFAGADGFVELVQSSKEKIIPTISNFNFEGQNLPAFGIRSSISPLVNTHGLHPPRHSIQTI